MSKTITWYDPKTRQKQTKTFPDKDEKDELRFNMFANKLRREGARILSLKKDAISKEVTDEPETE